MCLKSTFVESALIQTSLDNQKRNIINSMLASRRVNEWESIKVEIS